MPPSPRNQGETDWSYFENLYTENLISEANGNGFEIHGSILVNREMEITLSMRLQANYHRR